MTNLRAVIGTSGGEKIAIGAGRHVSSSTFLLRGGFVPYHCAITSGSATLSRFCVKVGASVDDRRRLRGSAVAQ